MKTMTFISFIFCITGFSLSVQAGAQVNASSAPFNIKVVLPNARELPAGIDEGKLDKVADMMETHGDEGRLDDEHLKRRQEMIANDPELGAYLVALADLRLAQNDLAVADLLEAMSLRQDVDGAAVERYIQKAERVVQTPLEKEVGQAELNYLRGMTKLLESRPSQKNEDLLVQMLPFEPFVRADRALAQMGSARVVPVLEKFSHAYPHSTRLKDQGPVPLVADVGTEIQKSLKILRTRLAGTAGTLEQLDGIDTQAYARTPAGQSVGTPPSSALTTSSHSWLAWGLGAAIMVTALFFVWQNSHRRR